MKNNDYQFNPADWQGRRQDQVESSYKVFGWAVIAGIIWIVLTIIA